MLILVRMTNQYFSRVHGHTMQELSLLLLESSNTLDGVVYLNPTFLGGWSNLNIRGHDSNFEFILKLPSSTKKDNTNPYASLFKIAQFISKSKISTIPLEYGTLTDSRETPFILFAFIEGNVYDSVAMLSYEEIILLKQSLKVLSKLDLPDLPRFTSPSEYLLKIQKSLENHEWVTRCSKEVTQIIESFRNLYSDLLSVTENFGKWSNETMHGDLRVSNIVFSDKKAVLLDLEECAIGDSLYDISYFLEEPYIQEAIPSHYLVNDLRENSVNRLRSLALSSIIGWCIERLLSMEYGVIEPNLDSPLIRTEILNYTTMKLKRLQSLLL